MTTIFVNINDEIYLIKSLNYNITTKSYKIDTEKLETWEKVTFSCPPESTILHLLKVFPGTPSNEGCEHVPHDLNNRYFTE